MVSTEDVDMFSVLVNRTNTKGYPGTIGAAATQKGQSWGTATARGRDYQVQCGRRVARGSPPCKDLTDVVAAMDYVLTNGSQLSSLYLYWKAINQGGGVIHRFHSGDIYVANTAFGTVD